MTHQATVVERWFGRHLRDLRKAANLGQSEMAARLGVTQPAVSAYEREKAFPPLDALKAMAEAYGVDFMELLDRMLTRQAEKRELDRVAS